MNITSTNAITTASIRDRLWVSLARLSIILWDVNEPRFCHSNWNHFLSLWKSCVRNWFRVDVIISHFDPDSDPAWRRNDRKSVCQFCLGSRTDPEPNLGESTISLSWSPQCRFDEGSTWIERTAWVQLLLLNTRSVTWLIVSLSLFYGVLIKRRNAGSLCTNE